MDFDTNEQRRAQFWKDSKPYNPPMLNPQIEKENQKTEPKRIQLSVFPKNTLGF